MKRSLARTKDDALSVLSVRHQLLSTPIQHGQEILVVYLVKSRRVGVLTTWIFGWYCTAVVAVIYWHFEVWSPRWCMCESEGAKHNYHIILSLRIMVERETGTNLVLDDIDGHGVAGGEMRRRRNENNVDDDDDELQPQPPPQPQQGQEQQHQPPFGPAWQNVLPRPLIGHPAVVAFQDSGASFLVSDPRLPGNPIVYANEVSKPGVAYIL